MRLLRALGLLALIGLLVLAIVGATVPLSEWSFGYLAALSPLALGVLMLGRRQQRIALILLALGPLALGTLVAARLGRARPAAMIVLPGGEPARLGWLVEERDLGLLGARWSGALHVLPPRELEGIPAVMGAAYQELERDGPLPTPALATALGIQGPRRSDVLVFEPKAAPTGTAVIFLHGFTGNFALQCGLVARPAAEAGALTVCPSLDFFGRWWMEDGVATLEETLAWLHRRGVKRVVLGGLSNGAIGTTRLAEAFRAELSGLLLVSGADPDAAVTDLPVLAIHGLSDSMLGVDLAQRYAARAGDHERLVAIPGGHLVLLSERARLGDEIRRWLLQLH